MKLLLIALTLLATTSYLLGGSKPMLACTPVDRYDPVRESKVIVAGRITGWEHTSDLYKEIGVPPIPSAVKLNVRVTVAVDQVLKGSASSPLYIPIVGSSSPTMGYENGLSVPIAREEPFSPTRSRASTPLSV